MYIYIHVYIDRLVGQELEICFYNLNKTNYEKLPNLFYVHTQSTGNSTFQSRPIHAFVKLCLTEQCVHVYMYTNLR